MAYPPKKTIQNPIYSAETDVDAPIQPYDTLGPAYEEPQQLYHTGQPRWESTARPILKAWSPQQYEIARPNKTGHDEIIAITRRMETIRLENPNPVIEMSTSAQAQSKPLTQSYFQRFKTFVWDNAQRRIATVVITSLIIGGIIGAYFGLSSSSSSSTSTTPSPDTRNCTYPEGVNSTFTQLQETLAIGNSSLSIPGLDPAICSLISMVINNTVNALKMGGYNCWQNVQSALMPLASSALALNMDSIQQIITSVKQYCFASSSTPVSMTSSAPITSPPNTLTTFTTTPTTSTPTTITTTTSGAGTTAITTSNTTLSSTVTSTVTSTTPVTLQTTMTSLVTTSTGKTTTLASSTTTTVPAGTTTITTLAPTSSSTVFVSSSTSSTIQTSITTTTPTTTTALTTTTVSTTQSTTSISSSTTTTTKRTTTTHTLPMAVQTEYSLLTASSEPLGITAGPDGNLWFVEQGVSKIGKITLSGTITEYPTSGGSSPYGITAGPDGNLWFTEQGVNKIGKITPSGTITEYAVPTANSQPFGITAGQPHLN